MTDPTTDAAYEALLARAVEALKALAVVPQPWRDAWIDGGGRARMQAGVISSEDFLPAIHQLAGAQNIANEGAKPHGKRDQTPGKRRPGRPTKAEAWLRRQLEGLDAGGE